MLEHFVGWVTKVATFDSQMIKWPNGKRRPRLAAQEQKSIYENPKHRRVL